MITSALRRGLDRGGWLPAAFLVLGLAAVAGSISGSPDASLANLRHYRSDWGVYPVGSYPGGWWSYVGARLFYPAIQGNVQGATFTFAIAYLGAATAIGRSVVDALRGDDQWPRVVSALAGFLPGYLMVLAPLQLLFASVSLQTATWIALVGLPIVAVVLHRRAIVRAGRSLRHDPATRRRAGASIVVAVVMVTLAAIHRLQAGNFFLVQDSLLSWLLGATDQLTGNVGSHLAQWNQQTDEWVFNAPMLFRSYTHRDALFSFYATQSLGLVSFACLVFGIVHRLAQRRRTLAAYVAVGVVLASTPLIYPWRYITVIGGDNPALWTGQTGRQIGIVAPWAALLLLGRQRRATKIAVGLATAGLAFTSIQNVAYVLAAVGAGLAWRTRAGYASTWIQRPNLRGAAYLIPVAVLAMIVYAFWWIQQVWVPTGSAWWLLGSVVLAAAGAVAIGLGTTGRDAIGRPRARPIWIGAWAATLAGGFMLSNNAMEPIFGDRLRHLLSFVLPGYGGTVMARTDIGDNVFGNLTFPAFSEFGCTTFYNYCDSFAGFLASFGFLLVVVFATWLGLGPLTTEAAVNARRAALLLMVAGLATAVTTMFFTGVEAGAQPNIFSRLLDVPYYGLLALAAMTFAGSRNRPTMFAGIGVLVVWSIVPLIGSRWPEQMITNSEWLLRHAGLS
jgi:hypothetical protein